MATMTRMNAPPGPPLVETKLRPPDRRAGLVARPELVARLDATADRHRLTLVSAAAGWGKTTLVGDWLAGARRPSAWVALDASDNDPARFWRYVAEALGRAGIPVDAQAVGALAGGGDTREAGLSALINAMDDAGVEATIALDDYHAISEPGIHDAVAFMVEHLPGSLRLVMTSRTDPPIGLGRLRARGDLGEIRSSDLRFSDTEAGRLLNHAIGLELEDEQVQRLRARTEGWAAGLYLAGLSLRGRDDAAGFIEAFAGDDRMVVDYLAAEVLEGQDPERRRFLLRTSVLSRLNGPLCDAVAQTTDAARTLVELERSNLFLVPLDSRREWFRYHHLFGELLRHELRLTAPEEVLALHRRAAEWHLAQGAIDDAIEHAAAAGELDLAADLIAEHWASYQRSGWTTTNQRWLALLPAERVRRDPRLCLTQAFLALNLGRAETALPWLEAAEQAGRAVEDPADELMVEAAIASGRSVERLLAGDEVAAVAAGRRAVELTPPGDTWWRTLACMALGIALHATDELRESVPILEEAVEAGRRCDAGPLLVVAACHLGGVDIELGDIDRAAARAREAIAIAAEERHSEYPHAAGPHAVAAQALAARGQHAAAAEEAARAVSLARRGSSPTEQAHARVVQGQVALAAGDLALAARCAEDVRALLASSTAPLHLTRLARELEEALAAPEAAGETGDLTDREVAVLRRLAGTASAREIAAGLHVSHNTVKTQVRSIYRKLGVATREEAVEQARERGILSRSLAGGA